MASYIVLHCVMRLTSRLAVSTPSYGSVSDPRRWAFDYETASVLIQEPESLPLRSDAIASEHGSELVPALD